MISLNVVILEDEIASRTILSQLLEENHPNVHIIGSFDLPEKAREFLIENHTKVDVLFLDLQLPQEHGLEFIQNLPFIPQFELIFATAYQEYMEVALNDFSAIYYLMKPFVSSKLKDAIDKVLRKKQGLPIQAYILDTYSQQKDFENGYSWHMKDVVFMEADGYITHIYLSNGKKISLSKNLSYFEEKYLHIASNLFFRCSRKYLINKHYIRSFSDSSAVLSGKIFAAKLEMVNGVKIGIPFTRLKKFKTFCGDE